MTDYSESLPNIAVVGLGKIGLTLAAVLANHQYNVFGADINPNVATSVNQGISHIQNEPGLTRLVSAAHANNTLSATTDISEAVAQAEVIVVIVPVLTDDQNQIDYRMIDRAVDDISSGIKKDSLVIFETTLPPGDTENRYGKKIEEISGLHPGWDFDLAYSPERVYSNQIIHDLEHYPKVVGGINEKSLERATAFYKNALGCTIIEVSSLITAEFSKVAECVYRDVNIALANELAAFAKDKDVSMAEVISASNSQPYANIHSPGIGVGGHCIPVYPYFFINKGLDKGLTPIAREINDSMAEKAIDKLEKQLGSLTNQNIMILGLSYRGDVKESTKSTALILVNQLYEKGAYPFINDPAFSDYEIEQHGAFSLSLNDHRCAEIDAVILQAFHEVYGTIDFSFFSRCQMILDGRNKLNQKEISRLGIVYEGIGNEGGQ